MKRKCRKAELMWWKTKPCTAVQTFFSHVINQNVSDPDTLLTTVDRLINPPN